MKKLTLLFVLFITANTYAQHNCGVDVFEKTVLQKNPNAGIEKQNYENRKSAWRQSHSKQISNRTENTSTKNTNSISSFCGYDNSYFTTISAPTVVGQTSSPSPNCTYGGEYITVTNLIAGNIYEISTCGANNFDTQLSIYTSGGGFFAGNNDDYCGAQSVIYFNPIISGDYDILIDEYDCLSNSLCSTIEVTLVYTPRSVITIPVVFHVVYKNATENISDQQIQSAIDALNMDFRRNNLDILNVPPSFLGESDDALFEFCLAHQDPSGNSTNGITRTQTSRQKFDPTSDTSIWYSSAGGCNSWGRENYLNIWVCDLPGDLQPPVPGMVGIGLFPYLGELVPDADGVVVDFQAVGTMGTATSPLQLNRNLSHEVGHYFGLHHVWGDDNGTCSGTDSIPDTPNQTDMTFGTPSFPLLDSCSSYFPGVLFYDYMDYSDDIVRSMFTVGQTGEMDGAIFTGRPTLITSNGCQMPTQTNESIIKNTSWIYPNPSNGKFKIENVLRKNFSIHISDITGRIVYYDNCSYNDYEKEIDISEIGRGIYFTSIIIEEKIVDTKKIIIQ